MKYILTCICRSSRWTECFPLREASAQSVMEAFIQGWLQRYGLPDVCYTDRGNTFRNNLWEQVLKKLGIKYEFTPLYHAATNGAIERQHQAIKNSLVAALVEIADSKREKWLEFLPFVMLGRRVAVQPDLGAAPVDLVFGESVRIPGQLVQNHSEMENVNDLLQSIQTKTNQPAKQMSRHNIDKEYFPDEVLNTTHVYIKVQHHQSLMPRFFDPRPLSHC